MYIQKEAEAVSQSHMEFVMSVCLNHTDTEAVTRCAACGKPICADCIAVSADGRDYCSQGCYAKGSAAAERSAGVVSEKSSTAKSRFIRFLIFLFLIAALVAAGSVYYKNNKKKLDRKFDSAIQQTQSAARKTGRVIQKESKAIKKTLDTDSKYKRIREGLVK